MRNPNGYGSVVKLSGNRRKPYMARKTDGYDDRGYPIYRVIGYYESKKDANIALAEYNKDPYDLGEADITLEELFKKWCENKLPTFAPSSQKIYKSYYHFIEHLGKMKYKDIRYAHMLDCTKDLDTYSRINNCVQIWRKLDQYAYELDIIKKRYSDSLKSKAADVSKREPFTPAQIRYLFELDDEMARITLVYIYTGLRATELLELEELTPEYLVGGKKSKASKHRYIPVHPAIRYIIEEYVARGYSWPNGYQSLYENWGLWAAEHGFEGRVLHECRHTFETELDAAGAPRKCIDLLTGHASIGTGQRIYNHKTKEDLKKAIEMIPDYSVRKAKPHLRAVSGGAC